MDVAQVARQPIFDRELCIFGFELLFRSSPHKNVFDFPDADRAVERLVHDSLHVFGLDRLSPGRWAFVNLTEKHLLGGIARHLPKDRVVVEILESVRPTDEVIEACRRLREDGYLIALDDFVLDGGSERLLAMADIVKVDFLDPRADPRTLARRLAGRRLTLLAEKIETPDAFRNAMDWGYDLFQGNFFAPAELLVLEEGKISAPKL
ncbi:MAG TPA: EAL domain-containing protein [Fredinandcohnia sp.]|nr:EAL domain-containing protein [Fredinandcohnia sp.]